MTRSSRIVRLARLAAGSAWLLIALAVPMTSVASDGRGPSTRADSLALQTHGATVDAVGGVRPVCYL